MGDVSHQFLYIYMRRGYQQLVKHDRGATLYTSRIEIYLKCIVPFSMHQKGRPLACETRKQSTGCTRLSSQVHRERLNFSFIILFICRQSFEFAMERSITIRCHTVSRSQETTIPLIHQVLQHDIGRFVADSLNILFAVIFLSRSRFGFRDTVYIMLMKKYFFKRLLHLPKCATEFATVWNLCLS